MTAMNKLRLDPAKADKVPFMEIFGPTIQGEGLVIGQKTIFLRTASCDFSCSWCDSKFTWDGSEEPQYLTARAVANKILTLATKDGKRNCNHVTLTGGNPALVGKPMAETIRILKAEGFRFSIETQGSRYQEWFSEIDEFVLSPKPPSSGMKNSWSLFDRIVKQLEEDHINYCIKIVIFNDEDFEFAREIFKKYPDAQQFLSVGNENANEAGDISNRLLQKLDWLWQKVLNDPDFNNAKPLPQLHTLIYANKRGV